jgi:polysaccharide biosynthesis protein PslH
MKILWVKPGKLLPLDTGGKLRTYNILRHLSARHELTYVSYYVGGQDEAYERDVCEIFPGTVALHDEASTWQLARYFDYARRFFSRAPYAVSRFADPQVHRLISTWFSERRFDVAVCDFLVSAPNFPQRLDTPTALFQHNVETILWQRRAEQETRWMDRAISKIEYEKMRRFEPAQVRRFHHVVAVSDADRSAMSSMVAPSHISVVPTGVDLDKYKYDPKAVPSSPLVVFTGSMDWAPNIDGVEFFCKEIWPRVLESVPAARFRIVGRDPHPRVKKLASENVEVTGTVPSIIDHLREAAVFVVPLRIGGGTRIKIYEAMALGKATVSTSVGAEGLDVRHDRDILLVDDPVGFAEAVKSILQQDGLRRRIEAAAAATAARYDWSVITEQFVEVLRTTIQAAGHPAASVESAAVVQT